MSAGVPSGSSAAPPLHRIVHTYEEFLNLAKQTPRGFHWEGVIPLTGVVLLVGEAFAGKSRLIATLFAAMRKSVGKLLDRKVRTGQAIYLALEHDPQEIATTLEAAALGAEVDSLRIRIKGPPFNVLDRDSVAWLNDVAEEYGARVIVIDSLRRCGDFVENDSGSVAQVMAALHQLTGSGRRVVIALHHTGRENKTTPRGSSDFEAGSGTVLTLTNRGGSNDRCTLKIHPHSARESELHFAFVHDDQGGLTVEAVDPAGTPASELKEEILAICAASPVNASALRNKVHSRKIAPASNGKIDAARDRLVMEGKLKKGGTPKRPLWEAT